jgi:hypothetical protein
VRFLAALLTLVGAASACASFGSTANRAPLDGGDAEADAGLTLGDASGDDAAATRIERYRQLVLEDRPSAYFPFEDGMGTIARNEVDGGTATAFLSAGGIAFAATGVVGRAIQLDATDAKVSLFGAMPFAASDAFSVEAWVELTLPSELDRWFFTNMDNPEASTRTGQWLFIRQGTLRAETWANGKLLFYASASTLLLPRPAWMHVVFLHSPAADKDELYVNAETGESARVNLGDRSAPLAVGLYRPPRRARDLPGRALSDANQRPLWGPTVGACTS